MVSIAALCRWFDHFRQRQSSAIWRSRRNPSLPFFHRPPSTIRVPARITPYLRSGLIAEFGSAIDALEIALAADEVDHARLSAGLTQLDGTREILDVMGFSGASGDADVTLDLDTPRQGRLLLDALRAVYDVEVQRITIAASDYIQIPSRELPTLRNFIVDVERQVATAVKRLKPILDPSEKRTPRSVKLPS